MDEKLILSTACPDCSQQPNEECIWIDANFMPILEHPRFHASRIEIAADEQADENGKPSDNIASRTDIDNAIKIIGEQLF